MELREIQKNMGEFLAERGWLGFSPNDVIIHLYEELSEIGKHLLFFSGYKNEQRHNKPPKADIPKEFGQAFSLFLQLSILLDVDLETAWKNEIKTMSERFPIDKRTEN